MNNNDKEYTKKYTYNSLIDSKNQLVISNARVNENGKDTEFTIYEKGEDIYAQKNEQYIKLDNDLKFLNHVLDEYSVEIVGLLRDKEELKEKPLVEKDKIKINIPANTLKNKMQETISMSISFEGQKEDIKNKLLEELKMINQDIPEEQIQEVIDSEFKKAEEETRELLKNLQFSDLEYVILINADGQVSLRTIRFSANYGQIDIKVDISSNFLGERDEEVKLPEEIKDVKSENASAEIYNMLD